MIPNFLSSSWSPFFILIFIIHQVGFKCAIFQSLIYTLSNVKCESTHLPHPLQLRLVAVDAGLEVETIQTPWFWGNSY